MQGQPQMKHGLRKLLTRPCTAVAFQNRVVMVDSEWDVFFSYRRHDLDRAEPLLQALADTGLRVWPFYSHAEITSEPITVLRGNLSSGCWPQGSNCWATSIRRRLRRCSI